MGQSIVTSKDNNRLEQLLCKCLITGQEQRQDTELFSHTVSRSNCASLSNKEDGIVAG